MYLRQISLACISISLLDNPKGDRLLSNSSIISCVVFISMKELEVFLSRLDDDWLWFVDIDDFLLGGLFFLAFSDIMPGDVVRLEAGELIGVNCFGFVVLDRGDFE